MGLAIIDNGSHLSVSSYIPLALMTGSLSPEYGGEPDPGPKPTQAASQCRSGRLIALGSAKNARLSSTKAKGNGRRNVYKPGHGPDIGDARGRLRIRPERGRLGRERVSHF